MYPAKPLATRSSVEVAILRGEWLIEDRCGQVDIFGDNDRAPHEAVDVANRIGKLVGRGENGNGLTPLGDDDTIQFVVGEAVKNVQAFGFDFEALIVCVVAIGHLS
jgi:hypothetical protein